MVRIGSLHDQMLLDKEARENKTNMTPGEQIDAAVSRIRTLCDRRDRTYADVLKKLEDEGISIVNFRQISSESEQYLAKIFREDYLPFDLCRGQKADVPVPQKQGDLCRRRPAHGKREGKNRHRAVRGEHVPAPD